MASTTALSATVPANDGFDDIQALVHCARASQYGFDNKGKMCRRPCIEAGLTAPRPPRHTGGRQQGQMGHSRPMASTTSASSASPAANDGFDDNSEGQPVDGFDNKSNPTMASTAIACSICGYPPIGWGCDNSNSPRSRQHEPNGFNKPWLRQFRERRDRADGFDNFGNNTGVRGFDNKVITGASAGNSRRMASMNRVTPNARTVQPTSGFDKEKALAPRGASAANDGFDNRQ